MPWVINGKVLSVFVRTGATTYQESDKIFREKMGSIMEEKGGVEINAKSEEVTAFISNPRVITFLAEKFSGVYRPQLSVTRKVSEFELRSAAEYLKRQTGYDWELKDADYVSEVSGLSKKGKETTVFCEKLVVGKEWKEALREVLQRIKNTTGLDHREVRSNASSRGVANGAKVWAWIQSPLTVKNLALQNTASETLGEATRKGDLLGILAQRMSAVVEAYSTEEPGQPESAQSLPLPFYNLWTIIPLITSCFSDP